MLRATLAQWYLWLVPVAGTALAFGVGHVSYTIYIPLWIVNGVLMLTACQWMGLGKALRSGTAAKTKGLAALFLILPWILISMFAGLGPPPETAEGWVVTAREQELRYCMLMGVGLFELFAFRFLYQALQEKDAVFASIGWVCMLIAIPLFFINMTYWSSYLPKLFQEMQQRSLTELPDWAQPLRKQFGMISVAEVMLTYFATAAFAYSLSVTGIFNKGAAKIYIFLSLVAAIVMMLSVFFPEPLKIPGFALSIPAFPFLMPYIMGIRLLKKTVSSTM
jgi:hypothetical protein